MADRLHLNSTEDLVRRLSFHLFLSVFFSSQNSAEERWSSRFFRVFWHSERQKVFAFLLHLSSSPSSCPSLHWLFIRTLSSLSEPPLKSPRLPGRSSSRFHSIVSRCPSLSQSRLSSPPPPSPPFLPLSLHFPAVRVPQVAPLPIYLINNHVLCVCVCVWAVH